MSTIKSLNKWANVHTYLSIDLLRIVLGVFLFWKGIQFIQDPQYLNSLFRPFQDIAGGVIALHYVIPAHIMGGILIAFGLLTRWAVIAQIPLLIGAVYIGIFSDLGLTNLILAFITLLVCVFFLVYGSGKHSADYFFKMQQ